MKTVSSSVHVVDIYRLCVQRQELIAQSDPSRVVCQHISTFDGFLTLLFDMSGTCFLPYGRSSLGFGWLTRVVFAPYCLGLAPFRGTLI